MPASLKLVVFYKVPHRDVWGCVLMSRFRGGGAWQNLNFDKEDIFGFETLVFATSGILSMHNQLVTLQRESKTWNRIIYDPFKFQLQVTLAECSTRLIWSSRAFILWPGSSVLAQSEPSRAAAGIYTNFSGLNWLQRCKIGRNGRA